MTPPRRSTLGNLPPRDELPAPQGLHPVIVTDERPFVVGFTKVVKAEEPWDGGWRWHKWGEYIGDKTPECEYIVDEGPDITEVYCYSICEVKAS